MAVTVRNGVNSLTTESVQGETVSALLNRVRGVLNLPMGTSLNVNVDGTVYALDSIQNSVVQDGTNIEFIQPQGGKQ
jgi:hypothetical protein